MRAILSAIVVAAGIGFLGASSASATPVNAAAIAQASQHTDQVLQVKDGCGRWHHRFHGRCVHD
jgi:hypothetical protein